MKVATFEQLEEYNSELESFSSGLIGIMWSVFSIANHIEDEQKVAMFLSVLSTKTYSLL